MTTTGRSVLATVLAAQALRGLGYGLAAVQLGAVLRGQGLDASAIGLVLAAIVAGSAAASLALGRWGDRLGRARSYGLLYVALTAAGVLMAAGAPAWLLALVALTGALSTEVVESGPFTTLEQVMLASAGTRQPQLVRGFGIYNAVATLAGAAGALLGTLPADHRLLGGTLTLVGIAGVLLTTRVPEGVEAPAVEGAGPRRALASSRGPVLRLAGLFAVDSLAGGLVVQAWIAYWLGVRYGAPTRVVGVVFAAVGLLQAGSFLAAPAIANRVGLLQTMVFTHLPSNLLLAAMPLAPSLWDDTIQAHRHQVRDAILDTTAALAAEHGLLSVTMSQIAEQAGIGRATLYKYFPDVEAILLAWHQRQITGHLDQLAEVRDQAGAADQRLEAVLEAYALIVHQSHGHRDSELAAFLHRDQQVTRAEQQLRDMLQDLLTEAAATGNVRGDVPPSELAGYCLHALAAAGSLPSRAAVHRLVTVTMAGLRPPR